MSTKPLVTPLETMTGKIFASKKKKTTFLIGMWSETLRIWNPSSSYLILATAPYKSVNGLEFRVDCVDC